MRISIIIPVKPDGEVAAIAALRGLAASSIEYEVIVAEGKRPSSQRNMAAREAGGDILYFLDDDSRVAPDALKRIAEHMGDNKVAAVGGPSITPRGNNVFQRCVAWVLASFFGGGAVRNRYRRHGDVRPVGDSELILCNLAFRRDVYLSAGGLDERLYPNEENELIDRLLASGHILLHDPDMYVERSQRPNLRSFIRQMTTYGRGRAEQTLLSRAFDLKALIPAFFVMYIVSIPFFHAWWYLLPAIAYILLIIGEMLAAVTKESFGVVCRLPMVYTLLHFSYGAGFIAGLFSPRYRRSTGEPDEVTLKWVKKVEDKW